MNDRNTIAKNNVVYESCVSIAKDFSYTNDYISKLAREGKITALKNNKRWYVERKSLEQFISEGQTRKYQQLETLSKTRKEEFLNTKIDHVLALGLVDEDVEKCDKNVTSRGSSALVNIATLCCILAGILLGVTSNPQSVVFEPSIVVHTNSSDSFFLEKSKSEFTNKAQVITLLSSETTAHDISKQSGLLIQSIKESDLQKDYFSDPILDIHIGDSNSRLLQPVLKSPDNLYYLITNIQN